MSQVGIRHASPQLRSICVYLMAPLGLLTFDLIDWFEGVPAFALA